VRASDNVYHLLSPCIDGMQVRVRFAQDKPVGIVLPRLVKCTVAKVLGNISGTDKKYDRNWLQNSLHFLVGYAQC
jgi:hypothetical protein